MQRSGGLEPRALRAWLAVAGWILLIALLTGGAAASAQSTGGLLEPLLRWLFPDISELAIWRVNFVVRKAAHLFEYAVLALLAFRALRLSSRAGIARHAAVALALVGAVAAADELRQTLSVLRSASFGDVCIDLAGGAAGLAIVVWLRRSPRLRRWFPDAAASEA